MEPGSALNSKLESKGDEEHEEADHGEWRQAEPGQELDHDQRNGKRDHREPEGSLHLRAAIHPHHPIPA